MLTAAIKERLKDPAYLDLHMVAVASINKVGAVPWYDAHFLRRFEAAKHYLAEVRPDAVDQFVAGFAPLRPPFGYEIETVNQVFDERTRSRIVEIARNIPQTDRETHENRSFGRDLVWDHPYFLELQAQLVPLVSDLAGRELVTGYNFLSLYGGSGKCDPHMDEPISMYTLDYCIEQSEGWPIHFSDVVEWPTVENSQNWKPSDVLEDPDIAWTTHTLEPNQALLFNGSSQWHYRDNINPGGFCNLLFFHYYPAGCENLVWPRQWHKHFDIPELEPLCELFGDGDADGLS
ncbi:MAG: hypothetical protein AAGK02_02505 [Pseudomonadota bacterium]